MVEIISGLISAFSNLFLIVSLTSLFILKTASPHMPSLVSLQNRTKLIENSPLACPLQLIEKSPSHSLALTPTSRNPTHRSCTSHNRLTQGGVEALQSRQRWRSAAVVGALVLVLLVTTFCFRSIPEALQVKQQL
jgi:hypothetical protein